MIMLGIMLQCKGLEKIQITEILTKTFFLKTRKFWQKLIIKIISKIQNTENSYKNSKL